MADEPWLKYQAPDAGAGANPWEKYGAAPPAATAHDPSEDLSTTQKVLAGVGKGFVDTARGVEQLAAKVGIGDAGKVQTEIDNARERDRPLMATKAGKTGEVVGQLAATAPLLAVPGANSYVGAAALGGAIGAAQPVATGESRTQNVLGGAAGGLGGKVLGDVAAKGLGMAADKLGRVRATAPVTTASTALAQGYKLPPSMAKLAGAKPHALDSWLESVAGKVRTEQGFSIANETNSTKMVRRGLGLGDGEEITTQEVQALRKDAGDAYNELKQVPGTFAPNAKQIAALDNISGVSSRVAQKYPGVFKNDKIEELVNSLKSGEMSTDEAVEVVKKLRLDANGNRAAQDTQTKALGAAQRRAADVVDDMLGDHLKAAGQPKLFAAYTNARQLIAKSYDVEKVITGNNKIDAVKLAAIAKKRPLSAELKDVAEFGRQFKGVARDTSKAGSRLGPAVSKSELGAAALGAAVGHPGLSAKLATLVGMGMAPTAARKYLLSDMAQRGLQAAPATLEQLTIPRVGIVSGSESALTDSRQ